MADNYYLSEKEELEYIQKINNFLNDFEKGLKSIDQINNYHRVLFTGTKTCDLMLALYTKKLGYKVLEMEMIPFLYSNELIPKETLDFLILVLDFRGTEIYRNPTYDFLVKFLNAFKHFFLWYNQIYTESFSLKNPFEIEDIDKITLNLSENKNLDVNNEIKDADSSNKEYDTEKQILLSLSTDVVEIKEYVEEMFGIIIDIQKQVYKISEQISEYQNMLENQIKRALSEDEKDRIIEGYIDSCVEKFKSFSETNSKNMDYIREKKKLKSLFTEKAWNKLSDESKTFLISSRVMFNEYIMIEDQIDYSGVCILVTKALELEITKRFFTDFLEYLDNKYNKNYSKYHTALTFKGYNRLYDHQFTMGGIAYVMCLKSSKYDTLEQEQNNKKVLIEYCKDCIFSQKSDEEIENLLTEYATAIETVRNDFRNPSAHRNKIKQGDAEACFEYIIDVDKILKKMLNSFDY